MENNNNSIKLVGALVLGAAVGAALGILFAPDKGSETRKKISSKGEDISDALKEKFNTLIEEVRKEVETVKDKAQELIDNGITKAERSKSN